MALDITTARQDIAKVYIAAFNRVPDQGGLDFWVNAYLGGTSLSTIANDFANSTEYKNKYQSYLANSEYVAAIYQNVFGRTVDSSGSSFWTSALNASVVSKAQLLNELVNAAMANGSTDGLRLTNQASFGVYCATNSIPYTNVGSILTGITSSTSSLDAAKTAASSLGNTLALTAVDAILSSTASVNVTPASSYLTNNADNISAAGYLGGSYIEDAKVGDGDILTATITSGTNVSAIKNIETINLTTNQTSSTSLLGVSGATAINISGGAAMFEGAQSQPLNLSSGYSAGLTANVTTVSSQGVSVTLNGVASGAGVTTNSVAITSPAIALAVASSSTLSKLDAGSSTAVINISGAGNLTVTDATTTGAVYASALTGTLTFSDIGSTVIVGSSQADSFTQASAANASVNGGSGNDMFVFGSTGTLTSGDTVDGGSGTDMLIASGYTATTDLNSVTNIETLTLNGSGKTYNYVTADSLVASGQTLSVDASGSSGSTLAFDGSAETNGSFVITGTANADTIKGGSASDTIKLAASSFGADTVYFTASGANADMFDFSQLGTAVTLAAYASGTNGSASEVKALYADSAVTASSKVYISYNSSNTATVYQITDGTSNGDLYVTSIGSITLSDSNWSALTASNFKNVTYSGGSTGGATTNSVSITGAGPTSMDSSAVNTTYTVTAGDYTYVISGFGAGDKIDFPSNNAPTVVNSSYTDGYVTVQYAFGGVTTTINLVGFTAAQDMSLNSIADFNTVFGAGTIY